jgi:hypothetical protein
MKNLMQNPGCMDGQNIIEMNNLSVGYFPSTEASCVGIYPPPVMPAPTAEPQAAPLPSPESETNS